MGSHMLRRSNPVTTQKTLMTDPVHVCLGKLFPHTPGRQLIGYHSYYGQDQPLAAFLQGPFGFRRLSVALVYHQTALVM